MLSRRALIVDRDRNFIERLRRCLRRLEFEVDVAASRREMLDLLAGDDLAIVFIAVERPKKSGFKSFTEVKQRRRDVPIVLSSSTVPMAELLLHQKLRLHADAYIDKRELGAREVVETLNELLSLRLDPSEIVSLARPTRSSETAPGRRARTRRSTSEREPAPRTVEDGDAIEEAPDEVLDDPSSMADPALASLLGDMDITGVDAPPDDPDVDGDTENDDEFDDAADEVEELREEVDRLKRELVQVKRSASSSPFSSDYLELSERVDTEERTVARLRREHRARARQVEALRAKLLQIARRLVRTERERDRLNEELPDLRARVDLLENGLRQAGSRESDLQSRLDEESERRESRERQHAQEREALEGRLAEERRRVVEVDRCHREELATAEERHRSELADVVEQERRRLDDDRQRIRLECEATAKAELESVRGEQATVAAARELEWQRRLDDQRDAHEKELEDRAELHRKELAELQGSLEQALLRKEHELQQGRADTEELERLQTLRESELEARVRRLRNEHEQELEARRVEHARRLDELRREGDARLEAEREEHRRAVDRLTAAHREEIEDRDRQHERSLERALEERDQEHHRAIERAIEERGRQHDQEVEQALSESRQEHVRETGQRLQEFEAAEAKYRANQEQTERFHKEQIELLKRVHEEEVERLKARYEREREQLVADHESTLAEMERTIRAGQELTDALEQSDVPADFDELGQEHARKLALELDEMRAIIDAFKTANSARRLETSSHEQPAAESDGDPSEDNSALLREIAEEMDLLGDSAAAADGPPPASSATK